MDCDCVQTTTPSQTTTEQGTTTPEATTEQASTTPKSTTEQARTMPEPTAPCACDKCVEKGNSIEDCEAFGMDCDCVQTTTPSQTTTEQGTTTPEPTTVQTTTTPKSTTPAAPCACDKCVELGNSIEDCKLFGMDCDCVQTTTPSQTTPVQTTTTPKSTTPAA